MFVESGRAWFDMQFTRFLVRPRLTQVKRPAEPSSPPTPRRGWRIFAMVARIAGSGADHDEAAFFRIEYGERNDAPRYTTARDEQLRSELLGPPPLGL